MNITATNKATGEVVDLPADSPEQIAQAWLIAQEYEKTSLALKAQLKKLVPSFVGPNGVSEPIGSFQFRVTVIQRMTYDKVVMRRVLDEDEFDVLLKPDKTAVDKYLKENLETLGEASTELRRSMIPEGNPYEVIRLEKLTA